MITVTSNADSGAGSLRAALAAATPGEEIQFSITGSIILTSAELTISQNQTITGPGSGVLTIDGGAAFRCLKITSGIVSISGLKFINGLETTGGGIWNQGTLTLSDIVITGNSVATDGAGIYNLSTIVATDLVLLGNTAGGKGGGVFNSGTLTITDGSITDNIADGQGGGLYNSGTATLDHVPITGNSSSSAAGGGFYDQGTITLIDLTVSNNTADLTGSGGHVDIGTCTFTRCTVSDHDEGVNVAGGSTMYVQNSTFSGNTDTAIFNPEGAIIVTNSTITNNGVGIFQNNDGLSQTNIYDTILAGNTTSDYTGDTADIASGGHNIFGTSTNPITPAAGDQFGLDFAALLIGPLQDNGGPTFTHALLPNSPALNSGDNTSAPATDQRGLPRIVNVTIDIGAYEGGCLILNTVLPEWITIVDNCLVGAAGVYSGATQEAANATAQAALDAFVSAAQDADELVCQELPTPGDCITESLGALTITDWEPTGWANYTSFGIPPDPFPGILTHIGDCLWQWVGGPAGWTVDITLSNTELLIRAHDDPMAPTTPSLGAKCVFTGPLPATAPLIARSDTEPWAGSWYFPPEWVGVSLTLS